MEANIRHRDNHSLLETIRCPAKLEMIPSVLPKANYVRPLMSRRETRPKNFSDLSHNRSHLISAGSSISRSCDKNRFDPAKLELLKRKYE